MMMKFYVFQLAFSGLMIGLGGKSQKLRRVNLFNVSTNQLPKPSKNILDLPEWALVN